MTALDWIRSKAQVKPSMSDILEYEGTNYRSEWSMFRGTLPFHMRKQLRGVATVSNEFEHETIRIVHTPSGHPTGEVEYSRAVYLKV